MKQYILILCVYTTLVFSYDYIIKSVRFEPHSNLLESASDGLLLVTLNNSKETTVCNYGFDELDASVACRTLGYPAKGYSILSDNSNKRTDPVLIGDFKCKGNETSLKKCSNSGPKQFLGDCGQHKMDVHVFCIEPKDTVITPPVITNCTKQSSNYRLLTPKNTNYKNRGFIQIMNTKWKYVCNDDYSLNKNFAQTVCDEICINWNNPLIWKPVGRNVSKLGDKVRLEFNNGWKVADSNVSCLLDYVAGVQCGEEIIIKEEPPKVNCSNTHMEITWNPGHEPHIDDSLILVGPQCNSLKNVIESNTTHSGLTIQINLKDVQLVNSDNKNIYYNCLLERSYRDNRTSKSIQVRCLLPKIDKANDTINFKNNDKIVIGNRFDYIISMRLYSDAFKTELIPKYSIEGENLYVSVNLKANIEKVYLQLVDCYVKENLSLTEEPEHIIKSKCRVDKYMTEIYTLGKDEVGFKFNPLVLKNRYSGDVYLVCETKKCLINVKNDCPPCGVSSTKRRKRSIRNMDTVYQRIRLP